MLRGGRDGGARRAARDVLSQAGALIVFVASVAVFLAGAVAGLQMIERLGFIGLGMYLAAIVAWGLLFVPFVVYAIGLHQRGSARHRQQLELRRDVARRLYVSSRDEDDQSARPPSRH